MHIQPLQPQAMEHQQNITGAENYLHPCLVPRSPTQRVQQIMRHWAPNTVSTMAFGTLYPFFGVLGPLHDKFPNAYASDSQVPQPSLLLRVRCAESCAQAPDVSALARALCEYALYKEYIRVQYKIIFYLLQDGCNIMENRAISRADRGFQCSESNRCSNFSSLLGCSTQSVFSFR